MKKRRSRSATVCTLNAPDICLRGAVSELLHAIHRAGAEGGCQLDTSAGYGCGAAVRNACVPATGKDCL